ncbi:hypothetical protein [Mogibacterium timidum]|uniref:hypothetical protein n=1 Tax=Mogibacterium timidum TaxID=35519 RepID=UPI00248BD0EF|nr:hypothetical protein [Mogibacterium timidum]
MGYIGGIFFVGHIVCIVLLLLYGLVTDTIATILFVVLGIPAALLMVFLFFTGQYWLFRLLHRLGCVDGDWDGCWEWHLGKK